MLNKEYCRYIRTYSELEGLQHAHTVVYCAAAVPQGAVLELRCEENGRVEQQTALARCSFARAMLMMRYLYENGVGLQQWLEVLCDAGQAVWPLNGPATAGESAVVFDEKLDFCAI